VRVEAVGIALIGVFGALLGVIAGEVARRRRDEAAARAQVRSAARMIHAELGMAALSLDLAAKRSGWVLGALLASLPTTGWAQHGAQLATAMDDDDFHVVMDAATKVTANRALNELTRSDPEAVASQMSGITLEPVEELVEACRRAQEVLSPFAYPSGVESAA
jgi:hypothetical protein